MKLGSLDITDLKIGTTEINEVRLGSVLVWERNTIQYLLDLYPAEVAWSLRKLKTATINVVKVRRAGDGLELDFNQEDITNGSLVAWVIAGGGSQLGSIAKWYNQGSGGSTYDITVVVAANQPYIVVSGALILDNGMPSVSYDPTAGVPSSFTAFTLKTAFTVAKITTANTINYILGNESPVNGIFYNGSVAGITGIGAFDGTNINFLTGGDLNQHLAYFNLRSSKLYLAKDGVSELDKGTFAASISPNKLGGRIASTATYFKGKIQEVILFSTDQSANKIPIETNINAYYGIY
jgi:hypothetical protein